MGDCQTGALRYWRKHGMPSAACGTALSTDGTPGKRSVMVLGITIITIFLFDAAL